MFEGRSNLSFSSVDSPIQNHVNNLVRFLRVGLKILAAESLSALGLTSHITLTLPRLGSTYNETNDLEDRLCHNLDLEVYPVEKSVSSTHDSTTMRRPKQSQLDLEVGGTSVDGQIYSTNANTESN